MERIPRLVYVATYGCQMNENDTEIIYGLLAEQGYDSTDDPLTADVIVINTCTVRHSADDKILGYVGQLKQVKEQRPKTIIAVGGCLAQDEDGRNRLRKRAPHIDVVFGTHNISQLPGLIEKARISDDIIVAIETDSTITEGLPAQRQSRVRAWLSITYGCDNWCSYCIVPHVRGSMRSRRPEMIIDQAQQLIDQGYREIFLLGQNVNAYGSDLSDRSSFSQLLSDINNIDGQFWIRFTTSHPRDFSTDMVDLVFSLEKVCPGFHLPLQSGSDKVLQKMNRGYSLHHYLELTGHIRRYDELAGISTDLIVGFPGETDEEFSQTLDAVKKVRFDQTFTFKYSPRSNTAAASLPEQVENDVKQSRLQQLIDVQYPISLQRNQLLCDRVVDVLVEGVSKSDDRFLTARTSAHKIVHIPSNQAKPGQFVKVKITDARTWSLSGEVVASSAGDSS